MIELMTQKHTPAIQFAQGRAGLSYGDLKSQMVALASLRNGTYSVAEVNGEIPRPAGGDGASAQPYKSANIAMPQKADLMIRSMAFATSRGEVDDKTSVQQVVHNFQQTDEYKTSIKKSQPAYSQVTDRDVRRSLGEQILSSGKLFQAGRGGDKMTPSGYGG